MKKRIMSLVLALVMCMGLAAPAFAVEESEEPLYEEHTIQFNNSAVACNLEDKINSHTTAQANIEAAKEYVRSLNLAEQGYEYIEESCLSQLESFSDIDDFSLESYTVLTPLNLAAEPTEYGEYKGFKFYEAVYSRYNKNVGKNDWQEFSIGKMNKQTLEKFVKGSLDWIVTFAANDVYSFSYTLLCKIIPEKNYVIANGDMIMQACKLEEIECRGIYTKSGPDNVNYGYQRYYSSEKGKCFTYFIYCPIKTGEYIHTETYESEVKTPNYDNKTYQMEQAYNWIFDFGGEYPARETLGAEVAKYRWG